MAPGPEGALKRILRHDVRTPLAVILGRCELLAAELHGPMVSEQLAAVEAIMRNAQRIEELMTEAVSLLVEDEGT